jgi:uncharacterized protein YjbI with pentapeptide repeats
VVPVSHKYKRLNQVAAKGMTSLFQQGGMVLLCFVAMLVITGGAPSGLAVGLTVGLSGLFVAWSEQRRLASDISRVNDEVTERDRSVVPEEMSIAVSQQGASFERDGSGEPSYLENNLQAWLIQLEQEAFSPNEMAILCRKFAQYSDSRRNNIEELRSLVENIQASKNDFLQLARLANLNPYHDFANTDLSKTDLRKADLSRANLKKAILRKAILRKADLSGADLSHANLSEAYLGKANLMGVNLFAANLSEAYLIGANLSEAYLIGADLSRANLIGANLIGANLSEAYLIGADLSRANLIGADLSRADVTNARFSSSYGISSELKQDLQNRGAIFEDASGDRELVMSRR